MQTTNKKFIDKKNIPDNKAGKAKTTLQKNETIKGSLENQGETKENVFSYPYQAEDEYADLRYSFERGNYDIGYQVLQNAFPFHRQNRKEESSCEVNKWEGFDELEQFQFKVNQVKELKVIKGMDLIELKEVEEEIYAYEESGSSDSQEESTRQNSNNLVNRES